MNPREKNVRPGRREELPLVRASSATTPGEIELHIEELVLHGFEPETRWNISDAVETELRGLLAEKGIPGAWLSNPERIEAGAIRASRLTRPTVAGTQIADAIYGGGRQ